MSAEAIGRLMPSTITLDDLAAMNEADTHGHRYETSTQGVLSVVPPPNGKHAKIATHLTLWLGKAGWSGDQIMQAAGLKIPGPNGDAGRIPDLIVWAHDPGDKVWYDLDGLLLIIEIISPGSEATDRITKVEEYAIAGVPQYWTVARDAANTVTLHRLSPEGGDYEVSAKVPLAWLLQTSASDHLSV
ncbi:Uma2 family endonuclease [Actinoplanes sp. NEAU-A12]|uniref:Uma2 family endonuclease n=1 Tax=Actinoplanes sandaracinus TaxID=3045177 RepID=A0ABT6WF99_9ACTN|nr:Uma2 family endonuclease [Actinoplanes sandaracinus]MDI6098358.1 Uma2 family endonuclease [Actinoplanes sandaracinus]